MFHLFDLPPEVHRMILQKLTTPELFDLITGRTKPDQVTNTSTEISQENPKGSLKILYQKARLELFKRRGPEASRLQSNLLASWLTHWSTEKKLSFIQNHSDKKEWLRLLDAALNDPQSSDEHKLRCCLLINKLFPDSQDIIPHITQTLLSDISNEKPVADELKAFTSEFLPVNISEIIDNLWAQLDDFGTSESKAAAQAMGAIAHRATQKQCGTMIGKLLTLTIQNGIAEVLKEIAPHATRAHCDSAISDLLPIMGKSDVYAFVESADAANAIIAIGPHASETECDEALANVLRKLKNDYGSLVAKQSGSSLGALVAHASKAQRDKMIFSFLTTLENNKWFDNQDIAILRAIVAHIPKVQAEVMMTLLITQLVTQLNAEEWYRRKNAALDMGAIAPHASKPQCDLMITSLLTKLNDASACEEDLQVVATALGAMAPYASKMQSDAMICQLLPKLNNVDANIRRVVASTLGAIAPHASKAKAVVMIDPLLNQLNDTDRHARASASKALGIAAAHASKAQLEALITALIPNLNDTDTTLRQSSASTLIATAPYLTKIQLKRLLELPGESNLNKMILKFAVQVRLHIYEINHPELNPGTQFGIYFDHNNKGEILEKSFNHKSKAWENKAFRFWSHARAIDDCMTEMPNKNKARV